MQIFNSPEFLEVLSTFDAWVREANECINYNNTGSILWNLEEFIGSSCGLICILNFSPACYDKGFLVTNQFGDDYILISFINGLK